MSQEIVRYEVTTKRSSDRRPDIQAVSPALPCLYRSAAGTILEGASLDNIDLRHNGEQLTIACTTKAYQTHCS
jgi:hypothetical protein